MVKIEDILSEDFSSYQKDTKIYMEAFTQRLRNHIKRELINAKAEKMLKDIDKSKDYFIDVLTDILENGCKGYNSMSTRTLLNIYLNIKNEEEFMALIEEVSNEIASLS